eukprot:EG_transcript_4954
MAATSSFRPVGSVRITLHQGSVKRADFLGKSDPYVKVTVDGTTRTTATQEKTLTPQWNETLEFPVTSQQPMVTFDAFDKDLTSDDPLGSGQLDLRPLAFAPDGTLRRVRVPLVLKGKEEGWLEVSAVAGWKVQQELTAASRAAEAFASILLTVEAGRGFNKGDLLSKPDPFVTIRTLPAGTGVFETAVVKNSSDPKWGESHEFSIKGETEFRISVFDKDPVGKQLLGEVQVPFKELGLQHGKGQRWIPVFKKSKEVGEVLILYEPKPAPGAATAATATSSGAAAVAAAASSSAAAAGAGMGAAAGAGRQAGDVLTGVRVIVVRGKELKGKGGPPTGEPFVQVEAGVDVFTSRHGRGSNPIWGATHEFSFPGQPPPELMFTVKERDAQGQDTVVGQAALPTSSITVEEVKYVSLTNDGRPAGELWVQCEPFWGPRRPAAAAAPDPAPAPNAAPAPAAPAAATRLTSVAITVKGARGLPPENFSDLYVRVFTPTEKWQTTARPKATEPTWDETRTFAVDGPQEAVFHIMDGDRFSYEPLAEAVLNLGTVPLTKGPIDQWLDLHRMDQHAGQLRVRLVPGFDGQPPTEPSTVSASRIPSAARPATATQPAEKATAQGTAERRSSKPRKQPPSQPPLTVPTAPTPNMADVQRRQRIRELQQLIEEQQRRNTQLMLERQRETDELLAAIEEEREELRFHERLALARAERVENERMIA